MASYVVFTRMTPEGRQRLAKNPQRLTEVRADISKLGARITQQYGVLGEYDFVSFIDAPNNEAIAKVGVEFSALGTTRNMTLPAVGIERFQRLLRLQPYRTDPHRWQTSWWASSLRRVGRYWTVTRHVRRNVRPLTVEGRENLAGLKGPAIVIGNHTSHLDSPVILTALPGRISNKILAAAAADKFFPLRRKRHWWYSLFAGAFPVHRGGGTKQLEYPMSLFKKGWSILIFPEGGRSKSGQIARFKAGPAMMAMACKVPVIPVYMEGLRAIMPKGNRYPTPGPARACIGKPISVANAKDVREATEMLENAMRELAGQPPHHHPVPQPAPAEAEPAVAAASAGGS
jgi:1-acyl-sn-glycerol-3-phosphate acyltransferase